MLFKGIARIAEGLVSRAGQARCERRYDTPDALTVPIVLEGAFRNLTWVIIGIIVASARSNKAQRRFRTR